MDGNNRRIARFIRATSWDDLPPLVQQQAKLCTLDLLGAIIAGSQTKVAKIIAKISRSYWHGDEATVLMAGTRSSLPGAILANAFTANALDIDDGYRRVKGHPGAVVLPAVLAAAESSGVSGKEFLAALVIAYEVAIRAGLAWHEYHPEYHGTGSWGALGACAGVAKILGLQEGEIMHALGVAEYHAPMVEMMRCIDYPAMTKDGIGWGSMSGAVAALMTKEGFTGIPSIFSRKEFQGLVDSLGNQFEILGLYFKPYACCRWAQPAVTGALQLRDKYGIHYQDIQEVVIHTFREASRLQLQIPHNTEEAQYNITYPVAAALVDGEVGPRQVLDENLNNESILYTAEKVKVIWDKAYDHEFPGKCQCELTIKLKDGRKVSSGVVTALGDPDTPLGVEGLEKKFRWLARHILNSCQVEHIIETVWQLDKVSDVRSLTGLLYKPFNGA